jgi:hypothetical protein
MDYCFGANRVVVIQFAFERIIRIIVGIRDSQVENISEK